MHNVLVTPIDSLTSQTRKVCAADCHVSWLCEGYMFDTMPTGLTEQVFVRDRHEGVTTRTAPNESKF
jgi:hypothetical protein